MSKPDPDRQLKGWAHLTDEKVMEVTVVNVDRDLMELVKRGAPMGFSVGGRARAVTTEPTSRWIRFRRWIGGFIVSLGRRVQGP